MNDVRKPARRKIKRLNIAEVKLNRRMRREVRGLFSEGFEVAGEHQRGRAQPEPVIGPGEAFEQPATVKAGAPGDKHPLPAQRLPQPLRVRQDVIEVRGQRIGFVHDAAGFVGPAIFMVALAPS